MQLVPISYNPFSGPSLAKVAPMSESQLEIWLSCLVGGEDANRSYNESVAVKLSGGLQVNKIEEALRLLMLRHEALRCTISGKGRDLLIYEEVSVSFKYLDIRLFDAIYQEAYLKDFAIQQATLSFDLVQGPLWRVQLFQLGEEEFQLFLMIHHIIGDGWSIGVMLQDLSLLYNQLLKPASELPKPPSITAYNNYLKKSSTGSDNERVEAYWLKKYQDAIPSWEIPTDYPRPPYRTYKSHRDDFEIAEPVIGELKKLGAKNGCSLVTTLICLFEVYLQILSQSGEIILGVPAAGQAVDGLDGLVGHCVNLLPIKSAAQLSGSFPEYLKNRKPQILSDYENQKFTFGTLLKLLNVPRDASRVPLVPIVLNIDLGLDNGVKFEGLSHQLVYNPREFENFEIFLNIASTADAYLFEWSYNTQLYSADRIATMMQELTRMMQLIIAYPDLKLNTLADIRREKAIEQSKVRNATSKEYPTKKSLAAILSEVALSKGDSVAITAGSRSISYQELEEQSNALANHLLIQGVMTGQVVGVAMERGIDLVIVLLGIMKAGAAYLPLDVEYPTARISYMLNDSQAQLLISDQGGIWSNGVFASIRKWNWAEISQQIAKHQKNRPIVTASGKDLAYILYTSGSTGQPKGVKIKQQSLVNLLYSMAESPGMKDTDVMLSVTTISFDIAGLELYLPLLVGGRLVIADKLAVRDGRLLFDLVKSSGASIMQATPATWKMLLASGWDEVLPIKVLCGGESFPNNLAKQLLSRCAEVWNVYGPTETTIWSLIHRVSITDDPIPIGKPIANTAVFILDDLLKMVPEGEVGEICIGGDGLADGYQGLPEMTTLRFIQSPFPELYQGKLYKTGDLGKTLPDGNIQCLGRNDQQVKVRGYRIELGEVENALIKCAGVKEAVVIVLHDRLLAYLTGSTVYVSQVKEELSQLLPSYMLPSEVVVIEQMPLTSNGKVDRQAVSLMAEDKSGAADYFVPAVTPAQVMISEIWKSVLQLDAISIQANFFEIGGHSLTAIEVMAALDKETGHRYPLSALFEAPTIQKLALLVQSGQRSVTWDSLVPMKPEGRKVPFYLVHGYDLTVAPFTALAQIMDENQPVFCLQAMGLNGKNQPHSRMEDIAAHYVTEILAANPEGPYALGGYSFGGVIAYEMTRQLESMGKTVTCLALLDTYAENADYFKPKVTQLRKKILRQFPKAAFIAKSFFSNPLDTVKYQYIFFKRRLDMLYKKWTDYRPSGPNAYIEIIAATYESAFRNYGMVPFQGKLDLFKVRTRVYYLPDASTLGWTPFAQKGVDVHDVEGDHKTFLTVPRNIAFAKKLQEVLDTRAKEKGFDND